MTRRPRPRCHVYVVELDDGSVYVGATSGTPEDRFRRHKAGGPTSSRVVRDRGVRLRRDLVQPGATEAEVRRELQRRGMSVRGGGKPFRYGRKHPSC